LLAWGFGRDAPEASVGMGRNSKKTLRLRCRRREALSPPPRPRGNQRLVFQAYRPGPQARAPPGIHAGTESAAASHPSLRGYALAQPLRLGSGGGNAGAKRDASPVPCRDFEVLDPLHFLKSEGKQGLILPHSLAPWFHSWYLPLRGKIGLGPGMAARFAKAPAGISASIGETKGFPQKEAECPKPRLFPGKNHRLGVSQSAALSSCPCGGLEVLDPLVFFEK